MAVEDLMRDTVTILTPIESSTDEFGDAVDTWSESSSDAYVEQESEQEDLINRDTRTMTWRVIMPAGTEVDGLCRVILPNGQEGELVGEPETSYNPARTIEFIDALVRVIEG